MKRKRVEIKTPLTKRRTNTNRKRKMKCRSFKENDDCKENLITISQESRLENSKKMKRKKINELLTHT